MDTSHDVIIVGGGVTGTALLYVLSQCDSIGRIALVEKNSKVAEVNSHPLNNAQTSHDGGTETNYSLSHALEVQKAAFMLRKYVEARNAEGLFKKTSRMVLGVGAAEVEQLRKRYDDFKSSYPDLRFVGPEELRHIEPMVMKGRDEGEPVCALVSTEGYAINYQKLSECFVEDALVGGHAIDLFFNRVVTSVRRVGDIYTLETNHGSLTAPVVVFAAGAYSLLFAQELGYGKKYGLLPVAGSFFSGGNLLQGKVYRVQIEGMPFAAIHGDPDVLNGEDTRFGPTTKPLPLMERHRYESFWDFVRLPLASIKGIFILLGILSQKHLFWYVVKNALYDIPFFGKYLFLKEARAIVPSLTYSDLTLRRGVGGIRPQIVNLETGALEMGDKTIVEGSCIFNTTPSPGASVCLANATRDAKRIMEFLGHAYSDPADVE